MNRGKAVLLCPILTVFIFLIVPCLCLSGDTGYTVEIYTSSGDHFFVNNFSHGGHGSCSRELVTCFCDTDNRTIPFRDVHYLRFTGKTRVIEGLPRGVLYKEAELTDIDGNTRGVRLALDNLNGVTDDGRWVLRYDQWDSIDTIVFARWGDDPY